jgi:hypothetical protein
MKAGDIILLTVISPNAFIQGLKNQILDKKLYSNLCKKVMSTGKNLETAVDGDYYDSFIIYSPTQEDISTIKSVLNNIKKDLGWTSNVDKYFIVNELFDKGKE